MTESNGNGLHVSETLKSARQALGGGTTGALLGMNGNFPGVRLFLVGGKRDDGYWPAGSITVRCIGKNLHIRLSLAELELEARYQDSDWNTCWDTVNNDLELDTVDWQLDYKGQQRMRTKLLA